MSDTKAAAKSKTECCFVTDQATSPEREDLARLYRALGHPARLAIVETLVQRSEACCGEIVGCLPLAQSTVSQHLQVLKEAGLLTYEARGRNCHYYLNRDVLARFRQLSDGFIGRAVGPLDAPVSPAAQISNT